MKQKVNVLVLKLDDANKIVQYLGTRPFNEVAGLINLFQSAKTATIDEEVPANEQAQESQPTAN